jgi:tryptophan halogenase
LRLDPAPYRARLTHACDARGIERIHADCPGIAPREDGGIAALLLSDERRIEADLFLDCAGPSAPLLSAVNDRFEDWAEWLPCDRLLLGAADGNGPSPTDQIEARPEGWRWSAPMPDRALTGFAYASAFTDEASARAAFAREGELVAFRPGRRREPWVRNVLGLGDAATAIDPLEGANLHLAQNAILRALELLPGRDFHPLELREYARRTEWETRRVRDFIAVHYLRSGRNEGELWRELGRREPPNTLARTLEQFERRGRLPFFEEESFDAESWLAVLIGLGVLPRHVDPSADGEDFEKSAAGIARYAEQVAALPARLPSYGDYLARMKQAPVRPPAAVPDMRPSPNPYRAR